MSVVAPRVIPCLLLRDGQLVKTRRFRDAVYVGDPVNVLSIFNSFEVDEIVLLDIHGAHRRTPTPIEQLGHYTEECFIPLAYGGGLDDVDSIGKVLAIGVEKAVLNTALVENVDVVRQAVDRFGGQAVVASIDAIGGAATARAWVRGGTVDTGMEARELAVRAQELGVGEILLTSVDREGTMGGFDLELITAVTAAVDVPVIAHGGAGRRPHLSEPLVQAGASAVAAGSLFVFQRSRESVLINYPSRSQIERLLKSAETGPDT